MLKVFLMIFLVSPIEMPSGDFVSSMTYEIEPADLSVCEMMKARIKAAGEVAGHEIEGAACLTVDKDPVPTAFIVPDCPVPPADCIIDPRAIDGWGKK